MKSGIVVIYTTKINDFAHFRSFLTLDWRHYDVKVMSDKIFSTSFRIFIKFPIRSSIICLAKMYFSANRMTFKAIFMRKTLKMTKMSTLWRHYDVKTTRDKIFNTIFRILVQFTLRLVIKIFFYRMVFRVKICERKKK